MIINNIEIAPGEQKKVIVNIAKLPSHSSIDISLTIARAIHPGPVLLLTGGLHGDEINGTEIVRRIIEQGIYIPLIGTVICIPIINVYGFIHFSRYVPDGKDVNRSFPGNKNGSLASRIAYYLMKDIIPKIDFAIDFHTGGADRSNFPQIRCMLNDPINEQLAKAFSAPFTLHSKFRPKSLRQSAARLGKRILVYEGGESSRFDEYAIRVGLSGTIKTMRKMEMTDKEPQDLNKETIMIKNSSWVRAKASGIFQSLVTNGSAIYKNQPVGYITDPFGDFKTIVKSPATGYIIGINNNPVVHQGDAAMHIGVIKDI